MSDILLTESDVMTALRVLFALSGRIDGSFLQTVGSPEIKKAFRRKALDTHPDRLFVRGEGNRRDCSERFIQVTNAYETLNQYVKLRDNGFQFKVNDVRAQERPSRTSASYRTHTRPAWAFHGRARRGPVSPFEGGLPPRPLRIGEFLYHSRVIPWSFLIDAIIWQRRQRPRLGEIAQKWNWLTGTQMDLLLRDRQFGERVGDVLLRHHVISPFQLNVLLCHQRKIQTPLGQYFVNHGLVTEAEVRRYLLRQRDHNGRYSSVSGRA